MRECALLETLRTCAATAPAATAIKAGDGTVTYGELWTRIERTGERLGSVGSDRCLLVPAMTVESVVTFYAAISRGMVPFLADPTWDAAMISRIAASHGVRRVLVDAVWRDRAEALPEADETRPLSEGMSSSLLSAGPSDAPALAASTRFVRFSSGSTGRPRGLEFSAGAALAAARGWVAAAALSRDDRVLCIAALSNGLAFNTSLLPVFLVNASVALYSEPLLPGAVLHAIDRLRPTIVVAFPFVYQLLLSRERRLAEAFAGVRLTVSSAAPLAPEADAAWRAATGRSIGHYFGLAEAGPVTFNDGTVPGRAGTAIPGNDLKIVADPDGRTAGRIAVRTPSMATGYVGEDRAAFNGEFDADGFLVTKDIGALDPDGRLAVHGRIGRLINIAGVKIDPTEIESVLKRLGGVEDARVEPAAGAAAMLIHAFVETTSLDRERIIQHCRDHLPALKIPHRVVALARFPRSASGKIDIASLRAAAGLPADTSSRNG